MVITLGRMERCVFGSSAPQHPLTIIPKLPQQSLAAIQAHPSLSVPGGSCPVSRQDPAPKSLLTAGPVITLTLPGSQHHPQKGNEHPRGEVLQCQPPASLSRGVPPRSDLLDQLLGTAADVPGHLLVLSCPCPSWSLSPLPDRSLQIFFSPGRQ